MVSNVKNVYADNRRVWGIKSGETYLKLWRTKGDGSEWRRRENGRARGIRRAVRACAPGCIHTCETCNLSFLPCCHKNLCLCVSRIWHKQPQALLKLLPVSIRPMVFALCLIAINRHASLLCVFNKILLLTLTVLSQI